MSSCLSAIRCPVCIEYYKDPRILDCGHTICKACAEGIYTGGNLPYLHNSFVYTGILLCPVCRQQTALYQRDTNGLKKNYQLEEAVQIISKNWTFADEKCEKHHSQYVLYCATCHMLLCTICINEKHKQHDFIDINVQYLSLKEDLDTELVLIKEMKEKVHSATESKSAEEKAIEKMKKLSKRQIDNCFEEIKAQLITKKKAVEDNLSNMTYMLERPVKHDKQMLKEELQRLTTVEEDCQRFYGKNVVYFIKVQDVAKGQTKKTPKCQDCDFDIKKLKQDNYQFQDTIVELIDEVSQARDELEQCSTSNIQLQIEIEELERALQEKTAEHEQMKKEVSKVMGLAPEVISLQNDKYDYEPTTDVSYVIECTKADKENPEDAYADVDKIFPLDGGDRPASAEEDGFEGRKALPDNE